MRVTIAINNSARKGGARAVSLSKGIRYLVTSGESPIYSDMRQLMLRRFGEF